ncbi:MAG: sporulation protein YqfD [Clostridia bacterium]|nr:sporulation protein YqfD [Clostridia bacterium]
MNRLSAVFGRVHFSVPIGDLTALYNLFLFESLSFSDFQRGEEAADFWVLATDARRLQKAAACRGIRIKKLEGKGLPALVLTYRRRPGLILGGLAAVCILIASTFFVWDLRIVGNERIPTERIEAILSENGLSIGTPIKRIHAGELENRVLISTDEISWISVNLHGTVAQVQVTEAIPVPAEESKNPANLVAAVDGQIEVIELYRGKSTVKPGQAVRAGELLVSGISDNRNGGFFYTRASGKVLARTTHEFSVEVPFVTTEERVVEEGIAEISLNFFSGKAKIYKRTGKNEEGCAIIETKRGLDVLGLAKLPLSLSVFRFRRSELAEVARDERQVLELAYAELAGRIKEALAEAELLKKEVLTEWTDTGVKLTCRVECIEDIAKQVEFEILP